MHYASMFGVSSDVRKNAEVAGCDQVDVDIELDTEPREVTVPVDFEAALSRDPGASRVFDASSYSQSAYVLWIESAKKSETRERRITEAIRMLREGRKQR